MHLAEAKIAESVECLKDKVFTLLRNFTQDKAASMYSTAREEHVLEATTHVAMDETLAQRP